jgi:hypothetical protein
MDPWSQRASPSPDHWHLNFLVRLDGRVIGVQSVHGRDFAVTREVSSGSWIGLRRQGRGIGTEMRAAGPVVGVGGEPALARREPQARLPAGRHRCGSPKGRTVAGDPPAVDRGPVHPP